MYNYIFASIYNTAVVGGKGKWLCKQYAANGVAFAFVTHFLFMLEILKTYFGLSLLRNPFFGDTNVEPFVVLSFFIAFHLFYSKARISRIEDKYLKTGKVNGNSILFVLSMIFIPLISLMVIGRV